MKRGTFKQKTLEEVKARQALKRATRGHKSLKVKRKKTKTPSLRQLKDKVWNECKRIVREQHGNVCYTCGKTGLVGSDWHTGHSKSKAALPLQYKFDIRGLRPQCSHCNLNLGGATDIFITKLANTEDGLAFLNDSCVLDEIDRVWRVKHIPPMGGIEAREFLNNLLEKYRAIL